MYYLPGGHIEPGEFAQDTLIRELKEEIGFDFEVDRYLGCMEYTFIPMPNEKVCHTHEYNFVFLAHSKMIKDTSPIPQREENVKLEWVKLSDLNKVKVLPEDLLKLLPIWLKEDHSTSLKSATG
jgi:8-oxo-dGTP pyrophosphatase MutT (NUDIX family)